MALRAAGGDACEQAKNKQGDADPAHRGFRLAVKSAGQGVSR